MNQSTEKRLSTFIKQLKWKSMNEVHSGKESQSYIMISCLTSIITSIREL